MRLAELTGTVQACVSLWEGGLTLADVDGTDLLTPAVLGLSARALALRGEAVFVIGDNGLLPCSDWDLTTRFSKPTAYRVGVPDTGGGRSMTVLAGEVLHFRVGSEMNMPYVGTAALGPLSRHWARQRNWALIRLRRLSWWIGATKSNTRATTIFRDELNTSLFEGIADGGDGGGTPPKLTIIFF